MNKHLNLLLKTVFVFLITTATASAQFPGGIHNHRKTNLSGAAASGDIERVRYLINTNTRNSLATLGKALILAAENGHRRAISPLMEAGANPDFPNANNETPVMLAAKNCHTDIVEFLIDTGVVDIDRQSFSHQRTALMAAAYGNCIDTVEVLIEAGANLDLQQRKFGLGTYHHVNTRTALIVATRNENVEIVRTLAKAGADPDLKDHSYDPDGETAWMIAYNNGNTAIMNILRTAEARHLRPSLQMHWPEVPQGGISGIVSNLLESDMNLGQVSHITGFSNEEILRFQEGN